MKSKNLKGACWLLGLSAVILSGGATVRAQHDDSMSDSADMPQTTRLPDERTNNAQMLIRTLSEELTEINSLAAQQARFRQMGGAENNRIARLWGRWIREHKAAGPMLKRLIRQNGGDPNEAKILKAPPLGSKPAMLAATHKDHMAAVMTSQMRYGMTITPGVKRAMHKRANLARKHIRQMRPFMSHMRDMREMQRDETIAVQG
jgi:hypothetical protein